MTTASYTRNSTMLTDATVKYFTDLNMHVLFLGLSRHYRMGCLIEECIE